jgi:hypothetical protein
MMFLRGRELCYWWRSRTFSQEQYYVGTYQGVFADYERESVSEQGILSFLVFLRTSNEILSYLGYHCRDNQQVEVLGLCGAHDL